MAKFCNSDVLDAAWEYLQTNANLMVVCSAEPTTRTEAVSTYALADVAVDSSDFTIAAGDTSGRKVTVAAQNGVTVDATGTATHIALVSATDLLYVTTCTSQVLTAGNAANVPAWDAELADPV